MSGPDSEEPENGQPENGEPASNGQPEGQSADAAVTLDSLRRYFDEQVEARYAAEERDRGVLARLTKLAIVMVCSNVVIAGANVAMIALRPARAARPTAAAPSPAMAMPPALPAVAPPATPALPVVPPADVQPVESQPSPPPEQKAPLFVPFWAPSKPQLVIAARRAPHPPAVLAKAAAEPSDGDDELSARPERW